MYATIAVQVLIQVPIQVTDAREVRPQTRPQVQRTGTRLISVDNVLQYASEIPSAQRRDRGPSDTRPRAHTRTPSGRHPLNPKLSGGGVPMSTLVQMAAATHLPARSSKTSEKLVLIPDTTEERGEKEVEDFEEDEDAAPPNDEALRQRRMKLQRGKSEAERLPKSQRTTEGQLARVTAYCTAQSYKLRSTAQFVRDQHGAKTKLYDDCLYCVYQLPLLGGSDGYRVRSSPVVKNPGGRSVLDEQIEANEQRQYRDDWVAESAEYSVRGSEYAPHVSTPPPDSEQEQHFPSMNGENGPASHDWAIEQDYTRRESSDSNGFSFPSPHTVSPWAHTVAELFIFSYGVAVLWNFTPNQEKDLLADLTFSSAAALSNPTGKGTTQSMLSQKAAALAPPSTGLPLMTRPLDESDFETEEFHFQYDSSIEKPRIFNDMITLRTSDHMIKLAMSHAIGQSTKLSFFEERMQQTMTEAQYVPRRLALEGRLGMTRHEVVGLVGRLFEGRVDVNLCKSGILSPSDPHRIR